ncbi:uncharacterized protein LOC144635430 [Oculina patagonica]
MNSMIEQIIGQCYECQVTTKQHRQEPIKVTDIPKKPWDVIAVDFSGPYPDGHYNLVAIDKRTRYPEVVKTNLTAFQPSKEKLKTMFATHGTPMLTGYRSTPHPATGVAPYEALMNRQVRTKLDHQMRESSENARDTAINERDEKYKEKHKQNAENRNIKEHNFIVGDHVLLKQKKRNKWSTAYEPAFYIVTRTDGSSIAARRIMDGREVYRDASQFKIANALTQDNASEERDDQEKEPTSEDWREKILLNANPQSVHEETITSREEIITSTAETSSSDKPPAVTRPRRDRRRPDYLKDYVT